MQKPNQRANSVKYRASEKGRNTYLQKLYKISHKEVERVEQIIKGVCTICGCSDKTRRLCVDHDHKTNKFRGLLCARCNRGIGMFRDNPILLEKASTYLRATASSVEIVIPIFD